VGDNFYDEYPLSGKWLGSGDMAVSGAGEGRPVRKVKGSKREEKRPMELSEGENIRIPRRKR